MEKSWKEKLRRSVAKLLHTRPQKVHFDYIAGLLSIPVLATAIILNIGNLTSKNQPQPVVPTPAERVIFVSEKPAAQTSPVATSAVCKKSIGPIEISSPLEGESVKDNPVCITIDYQDEDYCSVVWSYRINEGTWSEYNSNSPCLYNVPNGSVKFELRVKSTVSSDTKNLTRTFNYSGGSSPTSTPSPTSSPTPTP